MITVNNITKEFGGAPLFSGITFNINPRDRVGLAGTNGAGKTTLLKILNGLLEPEKGTVSKPAYFTTGYLPQEKKMCSELNVVDEAMLAFEFLQILEDEVKKIQDELDGHDYQPQRYVQMISRLEEVTTILNLYTPERIRGDAEKYLQ